MNIQRRRKKTEINIVPLIDVLIVLIFFFLMTMQFKNMNVLNITPPKMETAGKDKDIIELIIGIDAEGQYFIDDQPASEEDITAKLEEVAAQDEPPSILVAVDEDTPIKYWTFVLDESRKVKLTKIRQQMR
ncbi:MAG: biopolymer transporter ExbD [Verrucomicrobiota bacterium]